MPSLVMLSTPTANLRSISALAPRFLTYCQSGVELVLKAGSEGRFFNNDLGDVVLTFWISPIFLLVVDL